MARRRMQAGAAAAAAKWQAGLQAAGPRLTAIINAYNGDWTGNTVRAGPQYIANVQAAYSNGSWEAGVRAAGTNGWKAGMIAKGIPRLQALPAQAQQHYAAFAQQWFPAVQGELASLPARGNFAANLARSQAFITWEHSKKGQFRKLWRGGGVAAAAGLAGGFPPLP